MTRLPVVDALALAWLMRLCVWLLARLVWILERKGDEGVVCAGCGSCSLKGQ
jgi:hypothetical protein